MERIRVLLVDDHLLFREGLSRLLAGEADFEVVGNCGTQEEALAVLEESAVDVVLLDFKLKGGECLEFLTTARDRRFPARVLIVTAHVNPRDCLRAMQHGACGVFLKHDSPVNLIRIIRLVAEGEVWIDHRILQLMAEETSPGLRFESLGSLTERQETILKAVLDGLTNREIATRVGISEGAVKAVLQHLFEKTGVRTRSQLVRVAMEGGLGLARRAR
jgi:DNA-binding NarL/FixJ family response regulator